MNKNPAKEMFGIIALLLVLFSLAGCAGSKMGSVNKGEQLNMDINEETDVVNFSALKEQPTPTLAARGTNLSRGLPVAPLVGSVVSIATDAVKKVIANEKKKYAATYQFALTDLYFYDQLSNEGPFDPVGLQFSGFEIARTFLNSNGETDTAFTARFSLDVNNAYEMLNNSVFRLKLDDISIKYAKAKIAARGEKKLNMDIEISFQSSYVNQDAVLFDNVTLGKFYLFLRSAPLDTASDNYSAFYKKLKGTSLTGRSFIVPRSFGYHMEGGTAKPGYSQGAYSITVKVKESTKDVFISKVISEGSNIIDVYKDRTIKYINKSLPASMQ